jgi:hypothetical protein
MFDLSTLSEWDKVLSRLEPAAPPKNGQSRTFQRIIDRDDQAQCPFGFTKEVRDGQA